MSFKQIFGWKLLHVPCGDCVGGFSVCMFVGDLSSASWSQCWSLIRCAHHILFSLSTLPSFSKLRVFCCFCLLLCLQIILQVRLPFRALLLEPPHQRCLPDLSSMTYLSRVCLIFLHGLHSNMKFLCLFTLKCCELRDLVCFVCRNILSPGQYRTQQQFVEWVNVQMCHEKCMLHSLGVLGCFSYLICISSAFLDFTFVLCELHAIYFCISSAGLKYLF